MTIPLSAIAGGRLLEDVGAQFGSEGGWSGNPWRGTLRAVCDVEGATRPGPAEARWDQTHR